MKHILLALAAFAASSLGFYVAVVNAKALTMHLEIFAGGLIALGLLLAFPTDMSVAATSIANAVKAWRA